MPEQAQALRQTMANGGWDSLGREVKDFEEFWRFLNRITDPEESCPGCRTTGAPPFRGGPESCDIRECALKRKVDLCVNCRDWPCARIQRLGRTYLTLIADGKRLKKLGLDKWLKEQEARARTGFSYCDLRPPKGGDMENRDCPALLVPTVPRARSTQPLRGTVGLLRNRPQIRVIAGTGRSEVGFCWQSQLRMMSRSAARHFRFITAAVR
jgi:hypothetical protein